MFGPQIDILSPEVAINFTFPRLSFTFKSSLNALKVGMLCLLYDVGLA